MDFMNIMKKASVLLAAGLISVILLTGCGSIEDKVIGTWECEKISMDGLELEPEAFAESAGVDFHVKIEVTEDKLSVEMAGEEAEEKEYELKDNVLLEEEGNKLYYDEETEKLVMEGNADDNALKLTFVKK